MNHEITKAIGDSAVVAAVSTGAVTKLGWLAFLNANAPALGFLASVFFGTIGTFFYYLTWKKRGKPEDNERKIEQHLNEINELKRQIGAISTRRDELK